MSVKVYLTVNQQTCESCYNSPVVEAHLCHDQAKERSGGGDRIDVREITPPPGSRLLLLTDREISLLTAGLAVASANGTVDSKIADGLLHRLVRPEGGVLC